MSPAKKAKPQRAVRVLKKAAMADVLMTSRCEVCDRRRYGAWTGGGRYVGRFICFNCASLFAAFFSALKEILDERYAQYLPGVE